MYKTLAQLLLLEETRSSALFPLKIQTSPSFPLDHALSLSHEHNVLLKFS